MTNRAEKAPSRESESSPTLDESYLEMKAITLANDALLMQLVWILLAKGVLAKSEVVAAIDASVAANRRAASPEGQGAALYLEQIKAMFQASGADGMAH